MGLPDVRQALRGMGILINYPAVISRDIKTKY